MANLLDYLNWRGDLTLAQAPVCEVDALVFSALSYLPFSGLVGKEPIAIGKAARALLARHDLQQAVSNEGDLRLLKQLGDCPRFAGLPLADYAEQTDMQVQKQFCALTVLLPDGIYVVFRGTDGTLVGWKEDLNLSFSERIPAQLDALAYLQYAAERHSGSIRLCGHSKGGNLAIYAAAFCTEDVQQRIVSVHSHDGPGFSERIAAEESFLNILPRVHTFAPQTSVIGRLLHHCEDYTVVLSNATGLKQHNLFSWEVMGGRLVPAEGLTGSSDIINDTVKRWFCTLSVQERREIIDRLYEVLCASEAEQVSDLHFRALWKAVSGLDKQTRHLCVAALRELFGSAKSVYSERRRLLKG